MARTAYNLSTLLAFGMDKGMDLSDLEAIKEAYRNQEERGEGETRPYNRKTVVAFVTLPSGKVYRIEGLINDTAKVLSSAWKLASDKVKNSDDLEKVKVSWSMEQNLSEAIKNCNF